MYCPKCGSAMSDPNQDCQSCGHQLHAPATTPMPDFQVYQQPAKTSGMAIAALVLGLISLVPCLGFLTFIPAIVLSIVALVKISGSNGQLKGQGMAIAGLVVALLATIIIPVSILMPALGRARELAKRVQCQSNLSAVGRSVVMYRNEYRGEMPPTLEILFDTEGLSPLSLICPSSDDVSGGNSYIYRGNDLPADANGELIVAYDKYENHKGECRNVLFYNSSVKRLEELFFEGAIERDNEIRRDIGLPEKQIEAYTEIIYD